MLKKHRSESLLACIGAHGIFNALGVFANEAAAPPKTRILFALALTVITAGYGVFLILTAPKSLKDR